MDPLLQYAIDSAPSLIIDCSNCADPTSIGAWDNVFVIEVELLYAFRDVLMKLPELINELGVDCVVITRLTHLFSYQNEIEDKQIGQHCLELIRELSKRYNIMYEPWDTQ
jgi:hypothetical protein